MPATMSSTCSAIWLPAAACCRVPSAIWREIVPTCSPCRDTASRPARAALAAGLALPLLGWLGYAPGQQDPQAVQALSLAYGLLPCVLKLGAAVLLYRFFIRQDSP